MSQSEEQKVKKRIPVKAGVFDLEKERLIASRCRKCGECFHPERVICLNCFSDEMEEVALSTRGKIFTYSLSLPKSPGAPVTAPFIVAYVELPEKVYPFSLITGCELNEVKIGMDVDLYFWKVRENEEGNEIMAYGFRVVKT